MKGYHEKNFQTYFQALQNLSRIKSILISTFDLNKSRNTHRIRMYKGKAVIGYFLYVTAVFILWIFELQDLNLTESESP